MKHLANHIIVMTALLVLTLGIQEAYAQPIIPKPKSLSGPTREQQEAMQGKGATTGGYAVTVVIPFLTKVFIGFAGSFALISFVYGGFLYVVTFGDEGQVEKGKKIMIWAAVGLGIVMLSYAIVTIVLKIKIT